MDPIALPESVPLAGDGILRLLVKPSDGGRVTVNSHFEVTPEVLIETGYVPKEADSYSVRWGPVVGGNMLQNGKDAYISFYRRS